MYRRWGLGIDRILILFHYTCSSWLRGIPYVISPQLHDVLSAPNKWLPLALSLSQRCQLFYEVAFDAFIDHVSHLTVCKFVLAVIHFPQGALFISVNRPSCRLRLIVETTLLLHRLIIMNFTSRVVRNLITFCMEITVRRISIKTSQLSIVHHLDPLN